jgi:4-hydroxybenzoate polyprenyltransferase
MTTWLRLLRLHQWVKNLLLFVAAIAGHIILDSSLFVTLLIAFLSFSLLSSSVYVINDIFDLENDRSHPIKRNRSLASGSIGIFPASLVSIMFATIAFVMSITLPIEFVASLGVYFLLTTLYSLYLKKLLMLDVITLASLYTLRVIAGGLAIQVTISSWLLAFSFFIFLSLSFVKRSSELKLLGQNEIESFNGRAYRTEDLGAVTIIGISTGIVSVLIFALYLQSNTVNILYSTPNILWGAVPILLFWISYVWIKCLRGEVNIDPILFAIRDKTSLMSGLLFSLTFIAAQVI